MEHEEGAGDMPTLSPFRKSSQKRKVTTPRRELPLPVEDDFDVGSLLHSPAKTTSAEQEEKEDKKKKSQRPPMPHDVVEKEEEEEEKEEHVKEDASRREEKKKKPTDGKKKPPKGPAEDTPKKFGGWFKGTSEHEECVPVHKADSAAKKSKKKAVVDDESKQHPLAEVENLYPPKVTSSRIVPRKVLIDDGNEQEDEEESTTSTAAAAAAPARKKGTKRARSPVPSSSSPSAQAVKKGARITRPGTCIRVDWAHLPIREWGERPNATTIARDGLRLSWSPKCSLLTYAMTQFMPFCIPQTPSSRGVISCLSNMIFQDKMRDPRTEKKCFLNLLLEDVAASAPTPLLEFKLRLNNITSGTPSNVPVRYHGTQELDLTTMVGLLSLVQLCADPSIGRTADTTETQPTVTATSSTSSSDVATEETHQEKRRRRSAATADGEKRKRPSQQPRGRAPVDDEKEEKVHKEEEEEGSSDAGGSGSSSSSSDDDDDSAEREKERRMSHHHHHQHNQRHTDTDGDE